MKLTTIKKRSAFLHTQKHGLVVKKPLILVAATANRNNAPTIGPRVGFTVSKKIGKAVTRNKIRRRLKVISRAYLDQSPAETLPFDFVFIATPKTARAGFLPLQNQVKEAIDAVINQYRDNKIS
ncbi:MAG: ribonuclease P protein component [Hydrotalea sp.]|nr:ribonuclease P protein component [Hydrotalea sp.]